MSRCVICKHGKTLPGLALVPLNRANSMVVFRDVPADVCQICGEYYLTAVVSQDLLERATAAAGVEVVVQRYSLS
jgi:YgiT-type zinc finger domain-containing protein